MRAVPGKQDAAKIFLDFSLASFTLPWNLRKSKMICLKTASGPFLWWASRQQEVDSLTETPRAPPQKTTLEPRRSCRKQRFAAAECRKWRKPCGFQRPPLGSSRDMSTPPDTQNTIPKQQKTPSGPKGYLRMPPKNPSSKGKTYLDPQHFSKTFTWMFHSPSSEVVSQPTNDRATSTELGTFEWVIISNGSQLLAKGVEGQTQNKPVEARETSRHTRMKGLEQTTYIHIYIYDIHAYVHYI